jgi:transglutaminase-like putative cysteine protease
VYLRKGITVFSFVMVVLIFAASFTAPSQAQTFSNPQTFRIWFTVTIVNINSTMDRLQVYLPVPREWASQRSVSIERIEPTPTTISTDPIYGNEIAYFLLNKVPKHSSWNFTIQYTFTFYETHIQVDPVKVGEYNISDPEYAKYTHHRPAEDIESDDPIIQNAAKDIVGAELNPYLKAKRIYEWVVANIEYQYPSPWSAKETYLRRSGDCGKYTALFCAMCISQGIPARPVAGIVFSPPYPQTCSSRENFSNPTGYSGHVYAEFYLPNHGWIPVDGSYGHGSGDPERYFGNTWNPFVINSKGYGIVMVPSAGEKSTVSVFQHYAWWFWGEAASYDSYYTYTVEEITTSKTTIVTSSAFPVTSSGTVFDMTSTSSRGVSSTNSLTWKIGYTMGILLVLGAFASPVVLIIYAVRRWRKRPASKPPRTTWLSRR